jgi:uncharacterized membrane protein YeaQ/YmgE (transglycosylase-associated protein family)
LPLLLVILIVSILVLVVVFAILGILLGLLSWLIVGFIAGAIASAITHSRHGFLGDILIGLGGSIVGGALFALLFRHSPGGFILTEILAATAGAVILLLIGKLISRTA